MTEHYRNKDEFNVLKGIDGDEKTFGFFTGKPDGKHEVFAVRPHKLIVVKEEHKRALQVNGFICIRGDYSLVYRFFSQFHFQVFEEFVKQSPFRPCYSLDDGGYWRRLLLRSNLKGEVMAVSVAHPSDRTAEGIEEERKLLAQFFISNDVHLHSLYHQLW